MLPFHNKCLEQKIWLAYYGFIREFNLTQLRYQLISVKTRRDTSCHISKFLSYIISGLALTWLFGKIFILREWNFWQVWFRCLMGGEIMENGQMLWWTRKDFNSLRRNLSPTHFRLTDLIGSNFKSHNALYESFSKNSLEVIQGHPRSKISQHGGKRSNFDLYQK